MFQMILAGDIQQGQSFCHFLALLLNLSFVASFVPNCKITVAPSHVHRSVVVCWNCDPVFMFLIKIFPTSLLRYQ